MKLSDAIDLGSTLRPQSIGAYVDSDGTCAMGAALEAVGRLAKTTDTNERRIVETWPWLRWTFEVPRCPGCGRRKSFASVFALIIHLNDQDKLSRPQIAQAIAQAERQARRQISLLNPACRAEVLPQLKAHLPVKKTRKAPQRRKETRKADAVLVG